MSLRSPCLGGCRLALAGLAAAVSLAGAQGLPPAGAPQQPEAASARHTPAVLRAQRWMAVTAHPLASQAAESMILQGGSAVDAAIAAQMMLTLVEPQSSGIGGGGFLMHFDPASGRAEAFDGRETAPAALDEQVFLRPDGTARGFHEAAVGGLAVGVPGLVAMLAQAHRAHGLLPWAELFAPAIRAAREGFPVSERLHTLIARDRFLSLDPVARGHFLGADGQPRAIGETLRNPALADTLQAIAERGPAALSEGPIAQAIIDRIRAHPANPGRMSLEDLRAYRPVRREALCVPWRQFELCGMPPPSSGGVAIAQILAIFAEDPSARLSAAEAGATGQATSPAATLAGAAKRLRADPAGTHRFLEAARLAFADRDRYLADPDFVTVPLPALLDPVYLKARAGLIGERAMGVAPPGEPAQRSARGRAIDAIEPELDATTHLSIVDPQGRVVSMTSSIEDVFGARMMVAGFLLNNQLTDFSFLSRREGTALPNRVEPGKRPRSSMAPTLVFDRDPKGNGRGPWRMAIGSPGGASIIAYVARTLQLTLAEGQPMQQAIASRHVGNRNGPSEIEAVGDEQDGLSQALTARGHALRIQPMTSGLHGIVRACEPVAAAQASSCHLESGIDPRREGSARGH